nr:hypothetical protein Iba_scaffold22683CG0010 [Ipomoea batatas]
MNAGPAQDYGKKLQLYITDRAKKKETMNAKSQDAKTSTANAKFQLILTPENFQEETQRERKTEFKETGQWAP